MKLIDKKTYQLRDGRWVTDLVAIPKWFSVTGLGITALDSEVTAQAIWYNLNKEINRTTITPINVGA